eukprot:3637601-Prymnesium_polylepis.1
MTIGQASRKDDKNKTLLADPPEGTSCWIGTLVLVGRGIVANTVGIQLGWAIKALFDALSPSDAVKMAIATIAGVPVAYIAFAKCFPQQFERLSARADEAADAGRDLVEAHAEAMVTVGAKEPVNEHTVVSNAL